MLAAPGGWWWLILCKGFVVVEVVVVVVTGDGDSCGGVSDVRYYNAPCVCARVSHM